MYDRKIVLPGTFFFVPTSSYTKRKHTVMVVSSHKSGSHVFKFKATVFSEKTGKHRLKES
jgi:hypothetical protein